jgi:hypothetical protein
MKNPLNAKEQHIINMNELILGFKTIEEAQEFINTIVGDYVIVGLCENLLENKPFAFYVKEN